MSIKVVVVSHKEFEMPSDNAYSPFYVGNIIKNKVDSNEKILVDGVGNHIADKNPNYCELTAQYWLWKNDSSDIKGLVHYRRHFKGNMANSNDKIEQVLSSEEILATLERNECILPKKRNYYIENTYNHYKNAHNIEDLEETKRIIKEKYPEYIPTFNKVMLEKKSHRFNMIIANKEVFDAYSVWLFDILFELEKRIDISCYDVYQSRVFGFISERLLDVWVQYNEIKYDEKACMFMEKQNWIKKGSDFIIRKFIK